MLALSEEIPLEVDHTQVGHHLRKGRQVAGNHVGKALHSVLEAADSPPPVVEGANGSAEPCHRSTRAGGFDRGSRMPEVPRDCSPGEVLLGDRSYRMLGAGTAGVLASGIGHGLAAACQAGSGGLECEQAVLAMDIGQDDHIVTYVDKALDTTSFEFAAIQLFNSCPQICGGLELNKARSSTVRSQRR